MTIQAAIIKALGLEEPGKDRQAFLKRAMIAISDAEDAVYNKLPKEVTDWYNAAADVHDANKENGESKPLPEFPDHEEEKPVARRRASSDDKPAGRRSNDDESAIPLNTQVTVIKKSGREITGKLVERTKELVVLEVDGKDKEIELDDIGSIEVVNDGKGAAATKERGPRVGDTVRFTTKRGKTVEGELVELTEDTIVVKDGKGDEDDFSLDRIEGDIEIVGGAKGGKGKDPEPEKSSGRRRAASEETPDTEAKHTKSRNGGVSVGQRLRELVVDNMDATEEQIGKMLTKEKIEFRENTLTLGYNEAHKMLKLLKDRKLLK
jgi:ribosome maturation factor RimP